MSIAFRYGGHGSILGLLNNDLQNVVVQREPFLTGFLGKTVHHVRWPVELDGHVLMVSTMARTPIHPGEVLSDELEELGMSARELSAVLKVPANRLYQIVAGKRNVTADTALRLSRYFGTSADFWMNLQTAYELDLARQNSEADIKRIPQRKRTADGPHEITGRARHRT